MSMNERLVQEEEKHVAALRECLNVSSTPKHLRPRLEDRVRIGEWRIQVLRTGVWSHAYRT
jgi:hypothetical protein